MPAGHKESIALLFFRAGSVTNPFSRIIWVGLGANETALLAKRQGHHFLLWSNNSERPSQENHDDTYN
jgi:hypothetical protein